MKLRILSLLLVLMLVVSASAETIKLAYTGGSIKIRNGAGTKYAVNGYLKNGDTVTVLKKGSVWTQIQAGSVSGYVKSLYINGIGNEYASGTTYYSSHKTGTVKTKYASSKVNLRGGASSSTSSIGQLASGTKVTVLGKNGSWYLVETKSGTQGFISSSYLSVGGSSSSSSSGSQTTTAKVTGSCVNMRAGKGTSYARVTSLVKGTKVTVLDKSNSKWWKVKYGSYTGYMWSAYLK